MPKARNKEILAVFIGLAIVMVIGLAFWAFFLRGNSTPAAQTPVPWMGIDVKIMEVTANNTRPTKGVIVANVLRDSPAAKAGIEKGDVIRTVNNDAIKDVNELKALIAALHVGDVARVDIVRDMTNRTFYVKLEALPANALTQLAQTVDASKLAWGIIVSELTANLASTYRIPSSQGGVIVVAVLPGTQAAKVGFLPGDLIVSLNREATTTLKDFYNAIAQNGVNQVVILRDGKEFSYLLKVDPDNPPLASMGTLVAGTVARKVAVSATTPDLNAAVAFRFTTAPYFILYDTKYDKYSVLDNPLANVSKAQGGQVAQFLINSGAGAVITGSMGSTAFQYFESLKIPVYTGTFGVISEVLESYKKGELTPASEESLLSKRSLLGTTTDPDVLPTAGSSTSNRSTLCLCTSCGLILSHAAGSSCAQLTCPYCGTRMTRADAAETNLNQPSVIPGAQTTAGTTDTTGSTTQQPNSANAGPGSGNGNGYPPNRPYTVPSQQTAGAVSNSSTGTVSTKSTPADLSYSTSKDKEKIGKDPVNLVAQEITDKLKDKDKTTSIATYAVALDGSTLDAGVADDFSNAPYFLIIPAQGPIKIVPNPNATDTLDNDRQTAQFVVNEGATVAVAESFTDLAVEMLDSLRAMSVDGITGFAKQLYSSSSTSTVTDGGSRMRPGISTVNSSTASTSSTNTTTSSSTEADSEGEGGPPPNKGKAKGKSTESTSGDAL